ncbi:MAG: hypothetical protein F6K47_27265 [Symploca sp. SIO2E6]|nr:hypothetical protein [Symploca sp. SIO2E6]
MLIWNREQEMENGELGINCRTGILPVTLSLQGLGKAFGLIYYGLRA